MPFAPVTDIPDLDNLRINVNKVDAKLKRLVHDINFALKSKNNFKNNQIYNKHLADLVAHQLLLFLTTHRSMRQLIKHAIRKDDYPVVADAVSLGREQVEKIYTIALLMDNPNRWMPQYFRCDWKYNYEQYLLTKDEQGNIERFKNHIDKRLMPHLEQLRKPPEYLRIGPRILVSKFAIRCLNYNWDNPGSPKPSWFKRKGKLREFLRDYFEFPTPGKAINEFIDTPKNIKKDLRSFLRRWHKEYQYLCSYTHVSFGKMILQGWSESKNFYANEKTKEMALNIAMRVVYLSWVATASVCALIIDKLEISYGANALLKEFWEELCSGGFLGKSLWEIYIKTIV